MRAIGFNPSPVTRRPIFSSDGRKLGYVDHIGGRQVYTDVDGRVLARVKRYKVNREPMAGSNATGYTILYARGVHL